MARWSYALLSLPLCVGVWLGCNSRASDAGDFYEKSTENQCYIIKKCLKLLWNDAEWDNIGDCVDDCGSLYDTGEGCDLGDAMEAFDDSCPDYDEDKANDCLKQMIGEYNSCTPAHDYDDADFDCKDDPCANICGDCQGGQGQGSIPSPLALFGER